MGTPPAFGTRERDDVYVPERQTFIDAFRVLSLTYLSSKTKETAFQILNRTIWTNNKSFKSGLCPSPQCYRCEEIETMEHLLYLCPNNDEKLWEEFGQVLTQAISQFTAEYTARIKLTHPAILLRITDKLSRYIILATIQEIKRTIIFHRMQLTEPSRHEVSKIRMQAHLLSVTQKLISLLEYQGIVQKKKHPSSFSQLLTLLSSPIYNDNSCLPHFSSLPILTLSGMCTHRLLYQSTMIKWNWNYFLMFIAFILVRSYTYVITDYIMQLKV